MKIFPNKIIGMSFRFLGQNPPKEDLGSQTIPIRTQNPDRRAFFSRLSSLKNFSVSRSG